MKRFDRRVLGFLTREEITAIISAPDCTTWTGRRDHAMLATFYNTGARVSEIAGTLRRRPLRRSPCCLRVHGKGRKERVVPLWPSTCQLRSSWLRETKSNSEAPLFPARSGGRISRSGVEDRLAVAVASAASQCPTLRGRRVSPHTLRHTTAMHLLQSGVNVTVIALWLGHESPATTHMYIEADLAMKKRALDKLSRASITHHRLAPSDALLAFLDGL